MTAEWALFGATQVVPWSGFSPSDLDSNGLTIFATLGCILGLIGLLALTIAWITLMSDGWGPMLKAVLLGNRRGKRRFNRQARAKGASGPKRGGSRSVANPRGGWR